MDYPQRKKKFVSEYLFTISWSFKIHKATEKKKHFETKSLELFIIYFS